MEAFHALWLADWAESVTITGIDLHGERSMDLKEVYLVPITGRRVLSVKDHFPPTEKEMRYVHSDWDKAFRAVGSRLEPDKKYLFVAHLHASSLPASFDSIELLYTYKGKAYSTSTQLRVKITDAKPCSLRPFSSMRQSETPAIDN